MAQGSNFYAWRGLSKLEKQALQQERYKGSFGGNVSIGHGKTPYFWVQDAETPEGAAGASKAGITPTHFMRDIMGEFDGIASDAVERYMR